MRTLLYRLDIVLVLVLAWLLLSSIAPRPAPLPPAVVRQAQRPTAMVIRQWPKFAPPAQTMIPTPPDLPAPVQGCTRDTALFYLEAAVDNGLTGRATAWSCRSIEEAQQYLQFHIDVVRGLR